MADSDDIPTSDDIRDSVAQDVADGVSRFATGDTSVEAMDPMKRMDVADRIKRNTAASSNQVANVLGNTRRLISGGAYD